MSRPRKATVADLKEQLQESKSELDDATDNFDLSFKRLTTARVDYFNALQKFEQEVTNTILDN